MKIIDAHHHLWAPQTPELDIGYGWLKDIGAMKPFGDPTPIQRDYLLPEFLKEAAPREIAASVHVQADPKIPDPVAETAFVQSQCDAGGHSVAIVGFADLTTVTFPETLQAHRAYPALRGIRQILSHLPNRPEISFASRNFLDDLTWQAHFPLIGEAGLSFDLQLYPEQMPQAAAFLANHPNIPVVIDHLGSPHDHSDMGLSRWRKGMAALAELPHVQVKLSGYAMFFGGNLQGPAQEVTQDILTLFGADRVMWGSNFPVDSLHLAYTQLLDFVLAEVGKDEDARAKIFAENAERFYELSA